MTLSKASAPFGPTRIANGSRPKSSTVAYCVPSGADRCSGRSTVAVPLGVRPPHDDFDSVRLAASPRQHRNSASLRRRSPLRSSCRKEPLLSQ